MVKIYEYDWKGAEIDFKKALESNPGFGDCHQIYSLYLAAIGNLNEAILEIKCALEFDPLSSWYRSVLGMFLCYSGQYDKAIEIGQETFELDPNNAQVSWALALAYGGKRMYHKAISTLQRFEDVPGIGAKLGYFYGEAGKLKEAQKILDDFLARSKKGYFSPYFLATVYSGLGEKDKAFEWLDSAYEVRDQNQFHIKEDIVFHSLHSDPRWAEQLKKRGLTE